MGIWFYDTEECEKVLALLQGIASQHPQPPQPQTEEGTPASYPLTIGSLPPYSPAPPKVRTPTTTLLNPWQCRYYAVASCPHQGWLIRPQP